MQDFMAYMTAGLVGDLFASAIYVPSEVVKVRLQLQGSYNNPAFFSGYNYKSTYHAIKTIIRTESASALYSGYRATMLRDLPFSALQFAFYEQFKRWSSLVGRSMSSWRSVADYIPWEVVNGVMAGGLAGFITTPLDVVKTRIQTGTRSAPPPKVTRKNPLATVLGSQPKNIRTESVITALRHVYTHEGWQGLFRGMGPRSGWCGSQSGVMFLGYEFFLRALDKWDRGHEEIGR